MFPLEGVPCPSLTHRREPSGWAVSGVVFAASMLMLIGCFQVIAGLVAIFDDEFFVVARNYTSTSTRRPGAGSTCCSGSCSCVTGFGLFSGTTWAGVIAIGLAILSAIANFFFIPYYPFWSILVIALDVWVIWALTRPGRSIDDVSGATGRPRTGPRRRSGRSCCPAARTLLELAAFGAMVALVVVSLGRCSRSSSRPCSRSASIRSSARSSRAAGSAGRAALALFAGLFVGRRR